MNALLVCASPTAGSSELVARLATSHDLIVAVDGGGSVCSDAGVLPDLLVGDFDSLPSEEVDRFVARGVKTLAYPADKDETDLSLALAEARRQGVDNVTVTAASGGRLDHALAVLGALMAARDLRPTLREPDLSAWVLTPGWRPSVRLKGSGATVSVFALATHATVSATGLRWPLTEATLDPFSGLGVSNVVTDPEEAMIRVDEGVALVLSPRVNRAPAAERP